MKITALPLTAKQGKKKYYMCLYEGIRNAVLAGHMKRGDQLPSIRQAAKQLSLSRTTIESAYQRLCMEGLIIASAQRGYFVDVDEQQVQMRKAIIAANTPPQTKETYKDLRSSSMDATMFDDALWLHYLKDVLAQKQWIMSYGDPQGELRLRKALLQYSYAMRGVLCKEDQIVVGANFQSLLYLICSLYEGKRSVGMERGGFVQGEQVFRDCGFTIAYLDYDEQGITLRSLQEHPIGILYINTASCGTRKQALSAKRRDELLAYAREHEVLLLEDDHNGELRYQSRLHPAIQGFDMGKQVIYMRSFSKLLLPSVRMSFMVLNEKLHHTYQQRKQNYHPSSSKIEQLAFANYLSDGHMEKKIYRMRRRYEEKSTALMQLWKERLPKETIVLDESALQLLFYPKRDPDRYVRSAEAVDILIQRQRDASIALSFAAHTKEEIMAIMNELIDVWQKDQLV